MTEPPEPPPVTPELEEAIEKGEARMKWQDKWLKRLKLPLLFVMLAGLLPMLYFPDWRYSPVVCFGAVFVGMTLAWPFMTTGWPFPEIPRMLKAHMAKAERMHWEAQQRGPASDE